MSSDVKIDHMLLTATRPFKPKKPPSHYDRLVVPQDTAPQPLRITPRVLAILKALGTHRYLSSDQITRLDKAELIEAAANEKPRKRPAHGAYVRHLLRQLHRHALIERPHAQEAFLSSFLHNGNYSLAYAITRAGMRLLSEHRVPIDPRLDWTTKHTGSSPMFLAHALEISQFMLDCRFALPADRSLTLIDHNSLLPLFPAATRERKFPYQLIVDVSIDKRPQTLTVIPDRLFRLRADKHHFNFALEIDRGTETLSARSKKSAKRSTFRKKISAYYAAFLQDQFEETWGFKSLRIVTVTTSEARIEHMLALQREVTNDLAPNLFLYTTRQRIDAHGVLGPAWRSAAGDNIRLETR